MAGALDASFAQMIQQHSLHNAALANRLAQRLMIGRCDQFFVSGLTFTKWREKSKKEALEAATDVSGFLVDSVNGGVQESFINEKRIEMEARALASTVKRFTQTTTQWLTIFHTFDSALKEIGDFENWIKVMEYDCESVGTALRYITRSEVKVTTKKHGR